MSYPEIKAMTPLSTLLSRRKALNIRSTLSEQQLMARLRRKGITLRSQVIVGPFIVDILIPRKMLIVEVDGGVHAIEKVKAYDAQRTAYLERHGFTVVRVWNSQVNNRKVVEAIVNRPDVASRKACLKILNKLIGERNFPGKVVSVGPTGKDLPW